MAVVRSADGWPRRRLATIVVGVAASCVLLWVKARLFRGLEYTSDLFSALQASRSWIGGRPLLHENCWGDLAAIHNYYFTAVLGPLTWWAGAYGLFIGHALLLLAAWIELVRSLGPARWPRLVSAFAFLFGPVAAWMWDDPTYGWHAELLFLPLSVLFAGSLSRRSRAAWVWGLLLVLVHEEGAVLACSLQLLMAWLDDGPEVAHRERVLETARIAAAWGLVFAAGLLLLRVNAVGTTSRLDTALSRLRESSDLPQLLAHTGLTHSLMLFGAGLLMVAPRRPRDVALACAAALPLAVVILVASAAYAFEPGGADTHGATWPPRFVLLWSVLGPLLFRRSWLDDPSVRARWIALAIAAAAIALQPALLRELRGYDLGARAQALWREDALLGARLDTRERDFLACLGTQLPTTTAVAAHGSMFAMFHRHELLWPNRLEHASAPPRLAVCVLGDRLPFEYGCLRLADNLVAGGFGAMQFGLVAVAYDPALMSTIRSCVQEVRGSPAGRLQ